LIACLDNKQTLQRASVIGRIFQSRVLAYIYKSNRLEAALENCNGEFIQSRERQASETAGLEEGEYTFQTRDHT
jgi:hypothetical protein